ncbi:MAG: nuclear transport factor 2 family protein [Microbacterium enclense]
MGPTDPSFAERERHVEALFAALRRADVGAAVALFADDAHIMRIRYAGGHVSGGHMVATGRTDIARSLREFVRRAPVIRAAAFSWEGEGLLVRVECSLDGPHGGREQWSRLVGYDFAGGLISHVRETTHDDEE